MKTWLQGTILANSCENLDQKSTLKCLWKTHMLTLEMLKVRQDYNGLISIDIINIKPSNNTT